MTEQSTILSFRFRQELNQIKTIEFFSVQFETWFAKSASELNYTITDKSKSSWKQKTKSLKYTDSNLLKFAELLSMKKEKVYIDFEIVKNLENAVYKSIDIDFSILYNCNEDINTLNFVFNRFIYSDTNWADLAKKIATFLLEQQCEILYCFVLNLDNTKNPAFYVEGISNGQLNKKEEDKLFLWSNNKTKCDERIWDIFWGNIISIKHISNNQTLEDIGKIVGKENVQSLTPTLIWFNLNEPLTNFDILKYSSQRQQLYEYFNTKQLLLYSAS